MSTVEERRDQLITDVVALLDQAARLRERYEALDLEVRDPYPTDIEGEELQEAACEAAGIGDIDAALSGVAFLLTDGCVPTGEDLIRARALRETFGGVLTSTEAELRGLRTAMAGIRGLAAIDWLAT